MPLDSTSTNGSPLRQAGMRRGRIVLASFVACAALAFPPRAARWHVDGHSTADTPLATVAGGAIYEKELPPQAQGELQQLRQREYQVKRQAVELIVNRRLLEIEAKRKGVSVPQLLQSEPDQVPLLKRLRAREGVSLLLSPPRVAVTYDSTRLKGNPEAPVTIIEFADFNCPFCRNEESTLNDLLAEYSGKLKLGYRNFPLREIHPRAQLAAEASRCAAEQAAFWEYHDLLFAHSDAAERQALLLDAEALKLDRSRFEECLNEGKYIQQIEQDLQDGIRAGVSGTPAFFIDGIYLGGAQSAGSLKAIIETELSGRVDQP